MARFSIPRTGLPDLEFDGELVFAASGNDADGSTAGRRHELCIYRTAAGEFLVSIAYRSPIESEVSDDYVEVAGSPAELEEMLSLYDPTGQVDQALLDTGDARTKSNVLQALTRRYDQLVAQILSAAESSEPIAN